MTLPLWRGLLLVGLLVLALMLVEGLGARVGGHLQEWMVQGS
jgi:hypothetical protein